VVAAHGQDQPVPEQRSGVRLPSALHIARGAPTPQVVIITLGSRQEVISAEAIPAACEQYLPVGEQGSTVEYARRDQRAGGGPRRPGQRRVGQLRAGEIVVLIVETRRDKHSAIGQ